MTGPDKSAEAFGTQAISICLGQHPTASYMCRDIDPGKTRKNNGLHALARNRASPIVTNIASRIHA